MSDEVSKSTIISDDNWGLEEIPLKFLTSNRRKGKDLIVLADELGVSPFEILLHAAAGHWRELGYDSPTVTKMTPQGSYEVELLPIELRLMAAKEAAQYLHPKKKAIEHSGSEDGPPIKIIGTTDELVERVRARKI